MRQCIVSVGVCSRRRKFAAQVVCRENNLEVNFSRAHRVQKHRLRKAVRVYRCMAAREPCRHNTWRQSEGRPFVSADLFRPIRVYPARLGSVRSGPIGSAPRQWRSMRALPPPLRARSYHRRRRLRRHHHHRWRCCPPCRYRSALRAPSSAANSARRGATWRRSQRTTPPPRRTEHGTTRQDSNLSRAIGAVDFGPNARAKLSEPEPVLDSGSSATAARAPAANRTEPSKANLTNRAVTKAPKVLAKTKRARTSKRKVLPFASPAVAKLMSTRSTRRGGRTCPVVARSSKFEPVLTN